MILITGGLGYLGKKISENLLISGFKIRLATSRDNPTIPKNLSHCEIVKIDLSNNKSLENALKGIDEVIHLAALDASESEKDPNFAMRVNGLGTLNLLKMSENAAIKKFIYFSTIHVYGSPLNGFLDEEYLPRPVHPYSISHRVAEDFVLETDSHSNISGIIFRLSNAVGSPENKECNSWKLVVNDLCKQVILKKTMKLYSNQYLKRDFLPISSISKVLRSCLTNSEFDGQIFNLSSGNSLSLEDLTHIISKRTQKLFNFKPEIIFADRTSDKNPENDLIISNSKLKSTGIKIESDLTEEIDNILLNCKAWFTE